MQMELIFYGRRSWVRIPLHDKNAIVVWIAQMGEHRQLIINYFWAPVVELADTLALGASDRKVMEVRPLSEALMKKKIIKSKPKHKCAFCHRPALSKKMKWGALTFDIWVCKKCRDGY